MNLLSSTSNGQISGGGAIKKVLAFAAEWSVNTEQNKSFAYWQHLIHVHFLETSHLRYTMLSVHGKPPRTFDLPFSFLPRFFHVQYMSGLVSSYFSINHANEYLLPSGDLLVDAPLVLVTQVYEAGVLGTMLAQLRVILREWNGCWKIEFWDFIARQYEENIPRSFLSSYVTPLTPSPSTHSLPSSPSKTYNNNNTQQHPGPQKTSLRSLAGVPEPIVSEYGLSFKCIRTMEIAEMVHYMRDIIQYAHVKNVGAVESLKKIATIAELSQKSTTILGTAPTPPRRTVSLEAMRAPSPIALNLCHPMTGHTSKPGSPPPTPTPAPSHTHSNATSKNNNNNNTSTTSAAAVAATSSSACASGGASGRGGRGATGQGTGSSSSSSSSGGVVKRKVERKKKERKKSAASKQAQTAVAPVATNTTTTTTSSGSISSSSSSNSSGSSSSGGGGSNTSTVTTTTAKP